MVDVDESPKRRWHSSRFFKVLDLLSQKTKHHLLLL